MTDIDLSPATDTTVGRGDTLVFYFSTAVGSNGFCGITLQYTLPPL